MSSKNGIKTNRVDGDLSVGRNVNVGGKMTAQGDGHFKGGLRVDGWLEANNVECANKGVFSSLSKLRAAYPNPMAGWWAIVGTSLPGAVYEVTNGQWVATGGTGGNPSVNNEELEEVAAALTLDVQELKESVGAPEGIAPLDASGRISSEHLPAECLEDVLDFSEVMTDLNVYLLEHTDLLSNSENCSVVFVNTMSMTERRRFVLMHYDAASDYTTYYATWGDSDFYGVGTAEGVIPHSGKFYTDKYGVVYRWKNGNLVATASHLELGETEGKAFPGSRGKKLETDLSALSGVVNTNKTNADTAIAAVNARVDYQGLVNVNKLLGTPTAEMEFSSVLNTVKSHASSSKIMFPGIVLTYLDADGWKSKQWVDSSSWDSEENWSDFGSVSEDGGGAIGVGNVINVNSLCSPDDESKTYTLQSAIGAVLALEAENGVEYLKGGIVITFKTSDIDGKGAPVWLTYQFTRGRSDINANDVGPWASFGGGGGSSVDVNDEAEEGGKDAFSTGGAYGLKSLGIGGFSEDQDEEYIYYTAVNLNGAELPDVKLKIPKGGGGGGGQSSDSTLSIIFEDNAPVAVFGADIRLSMALRSVSYVDGNEERGVITNISILDVVTGLTLYSVNMNELGSANATDYKFELDFTEYFSGASQRSFYVQVSDNNGNTRKKQITISAIDITVEQPMSLNYTSGTALVVGGASKSIAQFYKFPKNTSSIRVTVEMFYGGEWRKLGESTVSDSYTKSISVNPSNVFGGGERLTHGSYPVRVYGTEVKSGLRGNTIYSTILCVDANNTTPLVAIRYDDKNNGKVRLYENLAVEVAAYTSGQTHTAVEVYFGSEMVTSANALVSETIRVSKQINGYSTDGTQQVVVYAQSGTSRSKDIEVTVEGSAIDAVIKDGALFGFDFSTRSNSESNHAIVNNGYELAVRGCNWSSNGFVDYLGARCLRFAENVTGEILDWRPYGDANVEQRSGSAIQFSFATKNIKNDEAKLIECYDPTTGAGFYVCGNRVAIFCKNGQRSLSERRFRCGEQITVGIVVEPSTVYVERGDTSKVNYSCIKLYVNGEECGAIGYESNSGAIFNNKTITFNGTDGDLYLYYFLAYGDYYDWSQAFENYLCKLSDTSSMITEYEFERVLDTQKNPKLDELEKRGIPYYVVVHNEGTFTMFDGGTDTGQKFSCTLYYYHPTMPWRSFKAVNVQWRRQGTTSAKRPIKNDRFYLKKNDGWAVTPIYPNYDNEDALTSYALMELGYVRVGENSIPVSVITVKVDYSDSSGVNDCGVCDLMNATYRALGSNYLTPAQRAFDGTWEKKGVRLTGLQMNHSTANHPIAAFRATREDLTDAWFHAKGNWKEDKNEQTALGFLDTPGYNLGCVNYGDFVEYIGTREETSIEQVARRFMSDTTTDKSKLYLLSLYCGENYRFMAYEDGAWTPQSGEMKQVDGKWVITGKVLNPVSGYELLTYDGLDWWQGVGSIDQMMEPIKDASSWVGKLNLGLDSYPKWTMYFECMIDDDQLQEDLARGKKVPYDLYRTLLFCNECDYAREDLAGRWQSRWKSEMWKYINPYSLVAYYLFTDYLAAVDQQAKNMQPMFFLEDGCSVKDGVYSSKDGMMARRMYCNKVYDCDTCNGKDNDGGQTIDPELDPSDRSSKATYMGVGSVLWNNIRGQQTMNVNMSGDTITLLGIASTMRSLPDVWGIGAGPFSPQGAIYQFVEQRMKKWPKVVSSFDGERKYINYTGYSDIYYYALQGLGLTSLPQFIEQRWRIRDGYYQCGDFKSNVGLISGRIGSKSGAKIRFRAAKDGYFGMGYDAGNIVEGFFLRAGEEGVFSNWQHDNNNILLYIYQADRMSMLDLSEISIDSNFANSLQKMSLLEELYLGDAEHGDWAMSPGTGDAENLNLGDMPFLRVLDVRNTAIKNVNASQCPRLETALVDSTMLASISLAPTCPIRSLVLPESVTEVVLNNLPNLRYSGDSESDGLVFSGLRNVVKVYVNGCPNVDAMRLLEDIIAAGGRLSSVRITDVNVPSASVEILRSLKASGAVGLDDNGNAYSEYNQCSGITGRWVMTELIEEDELESLQNYFKTLSVHNAQYSQVVLDDAADGGDSYNVTNVDNRTGYQYGNAYKKSGHFVRIERASHAYRAVFDDTADVMRCKQLDDEDYNLYADGSVADLTDSQGVCADIMKLIPAYWYKGVNDYKNQRKHFFVSSQSTEPISTSHTIVRKRLSEILYTDGTIVMINNNTVGSRLQLNDETGYSTYRIDVSGMKQVRFPGINNTTNNRIGGAFVDSEGVIVELFYMSVKHSEFDFVAGEYVFTNVPDGATAFVFTMNKGYGQSEAIAVDSSDIEAIEPDWVYARARLVGVYGAWVDGNKLLRSLSNKKTQTGTNSAVTSTSWTYDANGKVTNFSAPATLNYTAKDFQNLGMFRGNGYQLIDYELSKDIANLVIALTGCRDIQAYTGSTGCSSPYTTGGVLNDYGNQTYNEAKLTGNVIFGLQNFIGCNSEWMDHIAVNVVSYQSYMANKGAEISADKVDHQWHIYDPTTKSERSVLGLSNTYNGENIMRVRFGRYCDVIASSVSGDRSQYNTGYGDGLYYTPSKCRAVLRGGYNSYACSGLVYANASNASSFSLTYYGSRLAFIGNIVIED